MDFETFSQAWKERLIGSKYEQWHRALCDWNAAACERNEPHLSFKNYVAGLTRSRQQEILALYRTYGQS